MKRILQGVVYLVAMVLIASGRLSAQFAEDVLRYSTPGLGTGARSIGMGMTGVASAEDFSASYWNPASLGLMELNEISLGLSHLSHSNTSTFFNAQKSLTSSSTNLNSLGLVYAVPTVRGSLVVALGFNRSENYTTGLSFDGFNPRSSIVQSWAPDGARYPSDISDNLAYQLYLANTDTIGGLWDSRILDSVTQSGRVLEGGGLSHIVLSGSFEAARNLYLGATLNILTGSYTYRRNYYEDDINDRAYSPAEAPFDFTSLSLFESLESDLSGFSMKLGMLYAFGKNNRLGISIKTPSWMTIRETFSQEGSSSFDNGDSYVYPIDAVIPFKTEYDIETPYVFSAGLSGGFRDLTLSGDIEYTDWTQMEFRNADSYLMGINTDIKEIYQPTVNFHVGAEYMLPYNDVRLRAGFAYLPSPYLDDPASFAQKFVTGGAGFVIEDAVMIDVAYAYGFWETFRYNYDATSKVMEDVTTHNIFATVSYRF